MCENSSHLTGLCLRGGKQAFQGDVAASGEFQRQRETWLPRPPLDHRHEGVANVEFVGDGGLALAAVPEEHSQVRINAPWHDARLFTMR